MKQKITRAMHKYISLFLTAAILLTMQLPAQAVQAETRAQADSIANPVHTCTKKGDGTDKTSWSYVYFGSYPQSEVTGTALTTEIREAFYDANGDAWVGDTKYRRISKSDTNNDSSFGNSAYRYFKWERIRWRVLQKNGSTLFVVADKGLDCKPYHDNWTDITWEICTLRSWLNDSFYNMAFSGNEQKAIVEQTLVNERNPYHQTAGGNNTTDKIYVLSMGEATNQSYGFCETYTIASVSRKMDPSAYAKVMGAVDGWWWMRTPGSSAMTAVRTIGPGNIDRDGGPYFNSYIGVVPALHIELSSDCWLLNDDGTSGEGGGTTGEISNRNIIDRVSEYTTDELYAQYDKIKNSDYPYETKYKLYQSLFQLYGITDVQEGTHYLSNPTNKRYAYLALATDDLYGAGNFKYWLKNTEKGKEAQTSLLANGLICNSQTNDWQDFTKYSERDFPGVGKYKAMLYDFLDASSGSMEIVSNIKLISDMAGKATGAAKQQADNLIELLNHCSTAAEAKEVMDSSAAMEVWNELAKGNDKSGIFVKDNNGSIELNYTLDKSSGFGQFAKAMGLETKGISIAGMPLSDVRDLLTLDSKLAVYVQYKTFLQDIVSDTSGMPFQMRWAASLIMRELEEGYSAEIKDIAMEIISQTKLSSAALKQIIGKTSAGSLSSWLNVIGIESFFSNKLVELRQSLKKESTVEGYATLSSAVAGKLESSKQDFLADKTEGNAWDFYYNYNILYWLRYKGEEAYLSMTRVQGFLNCFSNFGYAEKEAAVNDTLQMLESRCRITLDTAQPVQASGQFKSKSVIICPVNVSVYAQDGTLIAELLDGVESDVENAYGRFAVVRDSYSGNYAKIICMNSEENVSFKIAGTDDVLVTMEFAQAKGQENKVYAFDSVPLDKGAVINTSIQEIAEDNIYGVDTDGDGEIDEYGKIIVKSEAYVPITSVALSETALELEAGQSSVLKVTITPKDATNQKVLWKSADTSIAVVTGGKVTAVAKGSTTIYCMVPDDMDKMVSCEVNVTSKCTHQNTEVRNQQDATCNTAGYTGDTYCKDCNAKIETGQVVPATGNHNTEVRNQQDATCKSDGYSGDVYCKDCNTKIESGHVIVSTGEHIWDEGKVIKSPTCTEIGEKEYTCTVCGETKKEEVEKLAHTYENIIKKATISENGSITEKCTVCGDVASSGTIFSVESAALNADSYTYDGKAKKPAVTVKDSDGKVISIDNYTVAYKDNKNVGKATVTIELKGNYEGALTKTFIICPKGTSISGKIVAISKGFTVKWKKASKSTAKYEIQISTDKKFAKKAIIKKTVTKSTTKLTVKKLKPKKKYYVRIRALEKIYWSNWSKVKTVTTKK